MADRVVSDQQLDEWEVDGLVCSLHAIHSGHLNALIAEVRASHAREAELIEGSDDTARICCEVMGELDAMRQLAADRLDRLHTYAAELNEVGAERDVLQQRIDKALAICADMDAKGITSGGRYSAALFRSALTGGEQE